MPGGPRGLQNRRRRASGEVGSIPILSAFPFSISDFAVAAAVSAASQGTRLPLHQTSGKEVTPCRVSKFVN